MTLSPEILNNPIPGAAPSANTINDIIGLTNPTRDAADIALGIEAIGLLIKNILGDLSTYNVSDLRKELYGSDIRTFSQITSDTLGVGLVPIGTPGSPLPQLEGTLLSFGAVNKVQILAYNSAQLWFRVASAEGGAWKKLSGGLTSHRFYTHTNNNAVKPTVQTHNISIAATGQTMQITLYGAGGGGTGSYAPLDFPASDEDVSAAYVAEGASESKVQYFVNNIEVYTMSASGGRAGNASPVPAGEVQDYTRIPDARTPTPTNFSIPGRGMPGGISQKWVRVRQHNTNIVAIPQDGLAGELSVGTFEVSAPGRLVITLAPGGRNAGYDTDDFVLNGLGYIGKGASAEVIMF